MIDLALWRDNRGDREIVNKIFSQVRGFLLIWSQMVIKQALQLGPGVSGPAWAIYRRWEARVAK